jgi:hypothetical protein
MLTKFKPGDNFKLAASIWRRRNCIVDLLQSSPILCQPKEEDTNPLLIEGAGVHREI